MNQRYNGFNGYHNPQQGHGMGQPNIPIRYVVNPTPYAEGAGPTNVPPHMQHAGMQPGGMPGQPMTPGMMGAPMGYPQMGGYPPNYPMSQAEYDAMLRDQEAREFQEFLYFKQQKKLQEQMKRGYRPNTPPMGGGVNYPPNNAYPMKNQGFGVPVTPKTNHNPIGYGGNSSGSRYRSKVDKPNYSMNQGQLDLTGGIYQGQAPQQPQSSQQPRNEVVVSNNNDELLQRIEYLERENINLKENLDMLLELYKNQIEPFIIGCQEKETTEVKEGEEKGVKTYTLYGPKVTENEKEELGVKHHFVQTKDNKHLGLVNPKDMTEYGDFNNIMAIGEKIQKDIYKNTIDLSGGETIYKHMLRVGENKVIKVDEYIKEHLKELNGGQLDESSLDVILGELDEFQKELGNLNLNIVNFATFFLDVLDELEARDGEYYEKYKHIPVQLIKYMMEHLRAEYNDFLKINMDLKSDNVQVFTLEEFRDPDEAMSGRVKDYYVTPEQINQYHDGVKALLHDYLVGVKVLKIELATNKATEDLEILLSVNKGYRVYSWDVGMEKEEIENLLNNTSGIGIVVPESHRHLYRVLESIMNYQYDLIRAGEDLGVTKEKFIHNTIFRVFSSSGEYHNSVAYKVYKTFRSGKSKPVYVLKKIFQSF